MKQCVDCAVTFKILKRQRCNKCFYIFKKNFFLKKFNLVPDILTDFQKEVLNGFMLGDGCLFVAKKCKTPVFKIGRAVKDKDYLLWSYNLFKDFCSNEPKCYLHKNQAGLNKLEKIIFSTRAAKCFAPFYQNWYPNGKKIVPKDLQLTPQMIAIWLADDGTIYPASKTRKNRINIKFYSNGFSKEDNEFLISLLSKRYDEYFSLVKDNKKKKTYYYIFANDSASRKIISDIDCCFPTSMSRKMYWKNSDACFYDKIPTRRGNLKFIVQKRLNNMIALLKIIKFGTASELATQLGWFHMEKGIKKPSKVDANKYLKKLLLMNLVYRDDIRDTRNHRGYVFHWKGSEND